MNARPWAAAALGIAGAALLRAGAATYPVALAAGLGGSLFAGWRTVRGTCLAFGLLVLAAALALREGPRTGLPDALPAALLALELFGAVTIVVSGALSDPPRLNRRLLAAWLASTGLVALGLSLGAAPRTARLGGALLAGGLAYQLGVVPAFAWAPLLLRHPAARVAALGIVAFVASFSVLVLALRLLPEPAGAALALRALAAVTLPWAAWHTARKWRADPLCARSYAAVVASAIALLVLTAR